MGWRGTTRSIVSAARAVDRENKRIEKARQKQRAFEQACDVVDQFEALVDELTSVHRVEVKPNKWLALLNAPEPKEPRRKRDRESVVKAQLEGYEPGFFDRLFKLESGRRRKLEVALQTAIEADAGAYTLALRRYEEDYKAWADGRSKAKNMLEGDPEEHRRLLEANQNRFTKIAELGRSVEFTFGDERGWHVNLRANGLDMMPETKYSVLQSGRLSEKNMPKGERMAIHQDNVCGGTIRCAVEMFRLLPIEELTLDATLELVDPATGHLAERTVLSVEFKRATLENLNLRQADASSVVDNFNHSMKFMKTKGLQPVPSRFETEGT